MQDGGYVEHKYNFPSLFLSLLEDEKQNGQKIQFLPAALDPTHDLSFGCYGTLKRMENV